jgi:transmembrane sensor
MVPDPRIGVLWLKFLRKQLTGEESVEFDGFLDADPKRREYFNKNSTTEEIREHLRILLDKNEDRILEKMRKMQERSVSLRFIWGYAAVILLVIFVIRFPFVPSDRGITTNSPLVSALKAHGDIPPGSQRATLTLDNGAVISLDNALVGLVANQGRSRLIKTGAGELRYEIDGPPGQVHYNSIHTPRGGTYEVSLSDGTKVWLNAASSLHFPTPFAGKERMVELAGEVYMEVARNPSRPFIVTVNGVKIEVLGTRLNIDAYPGEPFKTTLLEGSVKVKKDEQEVLLEPGQQALIGQTLTVNNPADLSQQVAWKNGQFEFHGAGIETVMNSLGRWYDVDVRYEGRITDRRLTARINKSNYISDVIQILENSGYHFRIEGRIIHVLPN